jgi:hypothetical protein
MATKNDQAPVETEGNTVPNDGDHDRVQMLSLRADGTPDQTERVELIGDPEATKLATREQFGQQAAAAVDVVERPKLGLAPVDDVVPGGSPDKAIDALRDKQQAAIDKSEKRADAVVDKLTKNQ